MAENRVYLDWNATAPLREEARAAMLAALKSGGNPSSIHAEGRRARAIVESARREVAQAVAANSPAVVFTSGGTEANALALQPTAAFERLLVSAIEHPSVLAGGSFPQDRIEQIPVTREGVIDLDDLERRLAGPPALVSVMLANNETGAIQPIPEVARLVHDRGGLLHVDAIQAFGKIDCDFSALDADLMSLSAHKVGGPTGIGALIVGPRATGWPSLQRGGGQELGRRAGTENLAGIAGFGAAAAALGNSLAEMARVSELRHRLETGLSKTPYFRIFSSQVPRLPNTTLFTAPGLRAETAVIGFDLAGISVSSGSACSSGKVQPSHVLTAMGQPPEAARGAIRVSLGRATTETDIQRFLEAWRSLAGALLKRDETVLERF